MSPEKRSSGSLGSQPSSVEASPASLTALRENVRHLVTAVTSGRSCGESFAKLNPDGSWVKTSRDSFQVRMDGSLEEYCETWPEWGIVADGVAGRLPMLERRIAENESSLLPTILGASKNPAAHGKSNGTFKQEINRRLAMLPTLRAEEKCQKNSHDNGMALSRKIALLPTPTSRDHKDTGENTNYAKLSRKSKLAGRIAMLPTVTTPREHDSNETCVKAYATKKQKDIPQVLGASCGLKLQPAFAEWMMGFPAGWTALDASGMQLSRSKSIRSSRRSQTLKKEE
jgi:hypothetical protein